MQPTRILVESLDGGGFIEAQFNPAEYTVEKGAQIAEIAIPGIDSPILQFVRGQNEKLRLELFFDTTEFGMGPGAVPVTTLTDGFYRLVKMDSDTHAPPRIRLLWGRGLDFTAIVESVQQKFSLFAPDGVPLRATLSLSLREYRTLEEQLKELKLESADHTRTVTVAAGLNLSDIAAQQYGDPALWRTIADANPVAAADPRRLRPGTVLEIPPLDPEAAP